MLIKSADSKDDVLAELEQLKSLAQATDLQRKSIDQELRMLKAGLKTEAEAAYFIDFNFKNSKNYAVLHDLRLELNGRVAQIDHLLINRTLDVYVLETKSFHAGVKINEVGEFLRWNDYKKTYEGMASPLEQNERHIAVLKDAIQLIEMPKRLGIRLAPNFKPYVLVATHARIERPSNFDTSKVIKADVLHKSIMDEFDEPVLSSLKNPLAVFSTAAKIVSSETVEDVARKLAALHQPIAFNYKAKFGISDQPASLSSLPFKPVGSQSGHQCRSCKSANLTAQHGKYGYYFKCTDCSGNTPIKVACNKDQCLARIHKEGEHFFRECAVCKCSDLYFKNSQVVRVG